ncbi:hypothetical protein H6P81_019015 [Aristolochia fimbriata]|uniref:non-specific serine/threonine protein kinase n=1 Tax=Aristolochia fimbriata TaxID=158543 RepID=A0AAV7E5S6_ARIFI|nr:hypothetical protein H6P81_019015 [Aristolochia fimbriata]
METPSLFFFFFLIFFITHFFSLIFFSLRVESKEEAAIVSTEPAYYYKLCSNYSCGNTHLQYPFGLQSFCSHADLKTTCVNNDYVLIRSSRVPDAETSRIIGNLSFDPLGVTIPLTFESLFGCGRVTRENVPTIINQFSLSREYKYGILLNCTQRPHLAPPGSLQSSSCLECKGSSRRSNLCFYTKEFNDYTDCEKFLVLTREEVNVTAIKDLRGYIRSKGYHIRFTKSMSRRNCESTGGKCGSSPRTGDFVCFCPSSVRRLNCSDGMYYIYIYMTLRMTVFIFAIPVSASLGAIIAIVTTVLLVVYVIRRKTKINMDGERGGHNIDRHFITLIDGISPTRYTYSQIKKFTSNFSVKLGEGGFGIVYKGFIEGIGAVAIKLLKRSERTQKLFMNEVATVGRIHHHNLVRLLGYCAQDTTRALVYQFIEMGSLDKYHIHDQNGSDEQIKDDSFSLTDRQMCNIAVETARGILYLHEGCRNKILHLDIKPQNVLIDSNLSPKVADFGLARMISEDHSHVSITQAQGTPGYAAPEMWTKAYGPLTEKTDVYSYGMLLLEMALRRKKNNDSSEDKTSHVYFPEWVLRKALRGELKVDKNALERADTRKEEGEQVILEKMCTVGLWCIQHIPSNRPTMRKVIQMLEGINNEIQIPPYPFPDEFNQEGFLSHYFTHSSHPNPHRVTAAT